MSDLAQSVLDKSSIGAGFMPVSQIYISPDRMREDTPSVRRYVDEELAPSFVENGCILLPVLHVFDEPQFIDDVPYSCELIAGWCRTQAFIALGCESIPYNTRKNLRKDQLLALELEENLKRKNFTWQETVLGIANTHRTKMLNAHAKHEKWGQKQTGALLGCSHGHVHDCVKIAEFLTKGDPEILAASNISEAQKIILGRKEDALHQQLAELSGAVKAPTSKGSTLSIGPVRGGAGIDLGALMETHQSTASVPLVQELTRPASDMVGGAGVVKDLTIDLSQMLFNMNNVEWFAQAEPNSVDLIYTDIPYGIDMNNLDFSSNDLDRVADEHDVEENVEQMRPFLHNAYKVLKDKSYLLFWYDIKHHEKLLAWGLEAGFSVQPYPLIWDKTHPCRNRSASTWWTKSIEYCMVMRKGTATLRTPQNRCVFQANGIEERKMQRNMFAKPFALSKEILTPIIIPGMTVLDCYAGEGSLVRAALNLGCRVIAVEKSEKHYPRLVEHVKEVYNQLTRNRATFVQ